MACWAYAGYANRLARRSNELNFTMAPRQGLWVLRRKRRVCSAQPVQHALKTDIPTDGQSSWDNFRELAFASIPVLPQY